MPVNPLVSGLDALTALTAGLNNGSNCKFSFLIRKLNGILIFLHILKLIA